MSRKRLVVVSLLLLGTSSCTSLWQQRAYQEVTWDDGDGARIEVWLRQGTMSFGQPWLSLLDILATPVLWIAETDFAWSAMQRDNARIAGGPFGYLVSLLPFVTCVPIDSHPSTWLTLGTPLQLPANERDRLRSLGECAAVEWLARHYEARAKDPVTAGDNVRYWVAGVRLAPPQPPLPGDAGQGH